MTVWTRKKSVSVGKVLGIDAYVYHASNKISFEIFVYDIGTCININISL